MSAPDPKVVEEIARAAASDEEALWLMLYYASHGDHEPDESVETAKANPQLARYVAGWGREGDIGFVAREGDVVVGAAWARLFGDGDRSFGWVDDKTPELAIALTPAARGKGIGSRLLEQLIAAARAHHPGLSLSVRSDNPALRLYERLGFEAVAQVTNRVGGLSVTMHLRFS